MSTAHDQLLAIARDASARYSATDLAHGYGSVTRRVRRDRTVRAGVTTLAGVGVVGAGTFGILHLRGADAPVLPASPSPSVEGSVAPSPTPTPTTAPSGQATEERASYSYSVHAGARVEDMTADLAARFGTSDAAALAAIVAALPPEADGEPEGWVLARDHEVDGSSLDAAAASLVQPTIAFFESEGVPRDLWKPHVTIATIVGAEAKPGDTAAMSGIAAVIDNRIREGMPLEVAAPLDYILRADQETVSDDAYAIDSPFNTYMYRGLPPTPLWSTGIDAFEAALHPAQKDWLYYATDEDTGEIRFASTFHEHQLNLVDMGLLDERDVLPEE